MKPAAPSVSNRAPARGQGVVGGDQQVVGDDRPRAQSQAGHTPTVDVAHCRLGDQRREGLQVTDIDLQSNLYPVVEHGDLGDIRCRLGAGQVDPVCLY